MIMDQHQNIVRVLGMNENNQVIMSLCPDGKVVAQMEHGSDDGMRIYSRDTGKSVCEALHALDQHLAYFKPAK